MTTDVRALGALLDEAAARRGSSTVLRTDGGDLSYADLAALVDQRAANLAALGVGPGSRVGLSAANGPDFVVTVFAVLRLGAAVVMVSTAWREGEVAHALDLTRPTHIVHDGSGAVVFAASPSRVVVHVDELRSGGTASVRPADVDPDALAVMVFSSGTTGMPKAVRHTHRTMLEGTRHWVETLGLTADDRLQIATPPFHILGLLNLLAVVQAGASVRLHRRFDLDTVLRCIESDRVTIEMAVAPIALAIAAHPDLESFDLSSLRYIMWGATPVTPAVANTITRRSGVRVMGGYGASEVPVIAVNPVDRPHEWRLDSVGVPPTGVVVRVVDLESGAVLAAGATGELQVLSTSCMIGYLPETEAHATDDGWYRTGDVGSIDEHGWITITDRVKEMIKVNGFQVAPAEIEAVLLEHDGVIDCAVFGMPHERTGEAVMAAVVVAHDVEVTADELRQLVRSRLASYKAVEDVLFLQQIPRLPSGKVLRRELQSNYRS